MILGVPTKLQCRDRHWECIIVWLQMLLWLNWLEQATHNRWVTGSSPVGSTTKYNMFTKLNLELKVQPIKLVRIFNNPTFSEFAVRNRNEVLASLNFKITPQIVNITEIEYPGSKPHTDSWLTSINFYLEAGDDETCFWEEKIPTSTICQSGPIPYEVDNLKKVGSFVASQNDCYLLNVHNIHSVNMNLLGSKRSILRIGWKEHSFDEVLDSIRQNNG